MTLILDGARPVIRVHNGDNEGFLFCSTCKTQTEHVFGWFEGHQLTCMTCHPEAQAKILEESHRKDEAR